MNSKYKVLKYRSNNTNEIDDLISIEEPLEITVKFKNKETWTENIISITMIGFPPAGGCTIFKIIIKKIPTPTAKAILIKIDKGIYFKNSIPINAVNRCPKKIFLGWAKGFSGNPYNNTIDEPKEVIRNKPKDVL